MTRTLYRWLVWLHPPSFRLRFEDELLWIFDENNSSLHPVPLVYDATISLLRQWILRSGIWKWVVGAMAAVLPLIIGFGSFMFQWPMHQ